MSETKTKWKKVVANSNLIQAETDRSVLIKVPKSKLKFWHPIKCVRLSGKNNYQMTISYTDDFTFRLFRNGEGRYNFKDILEERENDVAKFDQLFGKEEE